ncbi:uracil-DNA glycosylase [bacterium]|nr:uracil-DNA glycosylase [bacterium]
MTSSITHEWKAGTPAPGWRTILRDEFALPYMRQLIHFLDADRAQHTIYPEPAHIFRAYTLTDFADVKVVILGQDPYHGARQANGLAFSVFPGVDVPPSLVNIYKEIASDVGRVEVADGNLDNWASQGVFLLNTVLTVRASQANSHRGKGWEQFTGRTIEALGQREDPLVFMLWGRNALSHESRIDASRHLVLKAPHPSPLSAHSGFFGCRHFSKANAFLAEHGKSPIRW